MTYARVHIFAAMNGQGLAGEDLDAEFNAVQAECASLESMVATSGTGSSVVIDAGDARFAPLGTETNASRVAAAIQYALSGSARAKVVMVPATMWGYCADPDFNPAMFNASVLLVAEGALSPWYDPIAYGADASGVSDSARSAKAAHDHASVAEGPGARVVAFTLAGTYLLGGAAVQQKDVGFIVFPGVTLTGTAMDGDVAWTLDGTYNVQAVATEADRPATGKRKGHVVLIVDTGKVDVWDGDSWVRLNPDTVDNRVFTYNADAVGTKAAEVALKKVLHLKVSGNTDSNGKLVVAFADAGFAGRYSLANVVTVTATHRTQSGGLYESTPIELDVGAGTLTLDVDGGAQAVVHDVVLTFSA